MRLKVDCLKSINRDHHLPELPAFLDKNNNYCKVSIFVGLSCIEKFSYSARKSNFLPGKSDIINPLLKSGMI